MSNSEQTARMAICTNDYSVEVTLAGKDFDPDHATSILGIKPHKTGSNGDRAILGTDSSDATEAGVNGRFWSRELNSRDEVTQCRDHLIGCLIDEITPHMDDLREAGVERVIFYYTLASSIGLLNVKLNPTTMMKLGELGADLYISCFDCFDGEHIFWSNSVDSDVEQP